MIARVIYRTEATVWSRVAIYKTVEQSVSIYGRESWVVDGEMLKFLTSFHHRAERRITGMKAKRGTGREW